MGLQRRTDGTIPTEDRLGMETTESKTTLAVRSVAVVGLGIAALVSLDALDGWVGDWAAFFWICGTMFIPWLVGIAVGTKLDGTPGRIVGAAIGVLVVVAPLAISAATSLQDPPTSSIWVLAGLFPLASAVLGGMSLPVGIHVRAARGSQTPESMAEGEMTP